MNINSVNTMLNVGSSKAAKYNSNAEAGSMFKDLLTKAVDSLNSTDKAVSNDAYKLLINKDVNLHDIMIASEKADITLQLTLQIRNKIMDAYNEIMRMQV